MFFEFSNTDVFIQNFFFNRKTNTWIIGEHLNGYQILKLIFYKGIKGVLIIFGITQIVLTIINYKAKKDMKKNIFIIFSLSLIPLTVAGLKQVTNVYCPYELNIYNGNKLYIKLLEKSSHNLKIKGKGFPAGHASGGFSLMCLFFIMKRKILGFMIGFFTGWTMGLYQMMRGAHFLSHTIISLWIAWFLILFLKKIIFKEN
ncbi:MAG: phosphatase PAP2 family protein [Candidatus Gastranaerophilales bacterium]|nr:phosphatase PAP2 family protein [Candidatus Gastranaerophilales bacterium]